MTFDSDKMKQGYKEPDEIKQEFKMVRLQASSASSNSV